MTPKASSAAKKTSPPPDWHPADVKAALAKKGYTFSRISREYGYRYGGPNTVLRKPWSQIERIVADIVGVPPSVIWPSRYGRDGRPLKARTARVNFKRQIKVAN